MTKPSLFNGRVLLLGRRVIETRPDGALRLKGVYFETDYADYLAWREFGHPGEPVDNCFSMAALRSADGAFLLGEMAPHTYSAGQIYFPAGTPDPSDIIEDRVDLRRQRAPGIVRGNRRQGGRGDHRPRLDSGIRSAAHRLHEAHDACRPGGAGQGPDRRLSRARPARRVHSHAYRSIAARHRGDRRCRSSWLRICAKCSLKDRSDSRAASSRRGSCSSLRRHGRPRKRPAPNRCPA